MKIGLLTEKLFGSASLQLASQLLVRAPWLAIVKRNFVAVASVWIAICLSWLTGLLAGQVPIVFFVMAVVVSAGRSLVAGILATVLSMGAMALIFHSTLSLPLASGNTLALFLVLGILINAVCNRLLRQNGRLKFANAELKKAKAAIENANQQLVAHAEALAGANARLAEQKIALASANQQLRVLGDRLAAGIQEPLRIISNAAAMLEQSRSAERPWERINSEVQHVDTLVNEFAHQSQACYSVN